MILLRFQLSRGVRVCFCFYIVTFHYLRSIHYREGSGIDGLAGYGMADYFLAFLPRPPLNLFLKLDACALRASSSAFFCALFSSFLSSCLALARSLRSRAPLVSTARLLLPFSGDDDDDAPTACFLFLELKKALEDRRSLLSSETNLSLSYSRSVEVGSCVYACDVDDGDGDEDERVDAKVGVASAMDECRFLLFLLLFFLLLAESLVRLFFLPPAPSPKSSAVCSSAPTPAPPN